MIDRRSFLKHAGLLPVIGAAPRLASAAGENTAEKPDYTLRIGTGLVELAPDHIVSTTLYNGQFPGPLLRFTEGQRVVVDIYNDTDTPELVHWHGQMIPSDVDGASEEGSPSVPAHGMRRISFVPKPAGFRFYHTHVVAGGDLNRGMYTGQAGPVYIEPVNNPGAYDREVFLVLKEFLPSFSQRRIHRATDVSTSTPSAAAISTSRARPYRVAWTLSDCDVQVSGDQGNVQIDVSGDHAYEEEGTYAITATVTDDAGHTSSGSSLADVTDAALTGAGDMIWDWDVSADKVFTSPETEQLLGLKRGTLEGPAAHWLQILHPADRDRFRASLDGVLEQRRGRLVQLEILFLRWADHGHR